MGCWFVNMLFVILSAFGLPIGLYFAWDYFQKNKKKNALANAKTSPKDVVTVHCFSAAKTIPNPSPFVLKLLTYLRAAKIPFEIDTQSPYGPSDKSPWISLNGEHYTDSEVIINLLSKKFNKNFNNGFTDEELAIARSIRVMLEEHWFWCMPLWRFVWPEGWPCLYDLLPLQPGLTAKLARWKFGRIYAKNAHGHGVGRIPKGQLVTFMLDDMRTVSTILGNKKFIAGSQPCQEDFAIFGQLAQALWGLHGSPYEKYLKGQEGSNLREYLERMKELYWPDWDSCLIK